jgi:DNA-binding sugar fermentation-stimulating protein
MQFKQQLLPGILLRRYKRIWADIELADGRLYWRVLAHDGAWNVVISEAQYIPVTK